MAQMLYFRLWTMKKQKQEMPQLPLDVVIKVAFFIPEWTSLELFMQALHPANALGPLKHLWRLKELKWNSCDLWPHLNLTRLDEPSRLHVEGITKYYSRIIVDKTVNPLWLRQHSHSSTGIQWDRSYTDKASDFGWLTQWKHFRLTAVSNASFHSPNSGAALLIEHLPHNDYLVKLTWYDCSPSLTSAIFEFAATSTTLRHLHIRTFYRNQKEHCTITRSTAKALLKWTTSQPIDLLVIADFTWEDFSLRDQVAAALLNSTTIKHFKICGIEASDISFEGFCGYSDSQVTLDLSNPRRKSAEPDIVFPADELTLDEITRDLSGLAEVFFLSLRNPKVKKLRVSGYGVFTDCVIWEMLVPYLQESHLEEVDFMWNNMSYCEAILLAEGIRSMKSLKKIILFGNCLGSAGTKVIIAAAPASVNCNYIRNSMSDLTASCFPCECRDILKMAKKKSIHLFP